MTCTRPSSRIARLSSAVAVAALSAGTLLIAAPAASASPPIAGPELPPPVSFDVAPPYDDMSATVCDGAQANATSRIQTTDGFVREVYTLPGDTVEFVGLGKACQWVLSPNDALEWAFTGSEVHWTLTPAGATAAQELGSGDIVQEGREAIPTTSVLKRTMSAADDGGRLLFGTRSVLTSPNGGDFVSTATTLSLRVVDPKLQLTKEVCLAGTGCDAGDDAQWGPSTSVVDGADVQWRLTARNTGNIALNDVAVSDDVLDGGSAASTDCAGRTVAPSLDPGASAAIVCTTTSLRGSGAVVNAAKLSSTFTDPSPDGSLAARYPHGVQSPVATAEVDPVHAAIALVKEVCATGTGCDVSDDSQWVPRVTVPYSSDVQWRLTVTNTGDTTLLDVVPTTEALSGGKTGPSAECEALAFGTLAPGASRSLDCTTAAIDDTTQDTVNHAVVRGMPADPSGAPYSGLYPEGVSTAEATAAVATAIAVQRPQTGASVPPAVAGGNEAGPSRPAGGLASTGLDVSVAAAAGGLMLVAGAMAFALRRRAARQ